MKSSGNQGDGGLDGAGATDVKGVQGAPQEDYEPDGTWIQTRMCLKEMRVHQHGEATGIKR